ncbi:MAG: hypothetical protein LBR66_04145 [Candidatus Symbiothrix sp.]|jgi:hypothetical protein|nr:hypothetical protein [Candidatus Symbiothrix sp.]
MERQRKLFEVFRGLQGKYLLVDRVSKILNISEDSAYRRIRGETELSFTELERLCLAFGVPFEKVLNIETPYRTLPFQYYNQDYFNMQDMDFRMSSDYVKAIQIAVEDGNSEFGFASNTFTLHTRTLYPDIFRFYVMKWMYQSTGGTRTIPFEKIKLPQELLKLHKQYSYWVQHVKYTYVIYSEYLFRHMVLDIEYFRDIHLLTANDVAVLKDNLTTALKHIEQLSVEGCYKNGNRIDLYVSGVGLETAYSYLFSERIALSMIDAFTVGALSTLDDKACHMMRQWLQSLKRTSSILTGSEKNRIRFFEEQHAALKLI